MRTERTYILPAGLPDSVIRGKVVRLQTEDERKQG